MPAAASAIPLMPKATAVWLVENTALTFEQIAVFCALHPLEVQAIADGEVATGMIGVNPISNGQLTPEEIKRCEDDSKARLKISKADVPLPQSRSKGPRYTPITKRNDKPDGIAWLLKHHGELSDAQIARLLGTTKEMIDKVRGRTHWNAANIHAQNPVLSGLCKQSDLDAAITKALAAQARLAASVPPVANEDNPPADVPVDEDEDS